MERMHGTDAYLLHLERVAPMHTLKVVVLDSSRRGRQVTLAEVVTAAEHLLGHWHRGTQTVRYAPFLRARPFWVDAHDVDVASHVDERTVADPGDRDSFDAALSALASERLDLDRPLWSATLLHGLQGGRQAVVVRVHHATCDGGASVAAFEAFTTAEPSSMDDWEHAAPRDFRPHTPRELAQAVVAHTGPWFQGVPLLAQELRSSSKIARRFRAEQDMPGGANVHRNSMNKPFGERRLCVTAALPLEDFLEIRRATGATINGILHCIIGEAIRKELMRRSEDVTKPLIAAFGISTDAPGVLRLHGNHVAATFISLCTDTADPIERLARVDASARGGVELRRAVGLAMQARLMDYTPRLGPAIIGVVGKVRSAGHVVTANVAGPREARWAGDVLVAEWYSAAVLVPPLGINVTAHSYAGTFNIGLLTEPSLHSDPRQLLDDMRDCLAELKTAQAVPSA